MNITKIAIMILALSSFFNACTNSKKEKQIAKIVQNTNYPIEINLDIIEKQNEERYLSSVFKPKVKTIILETNDDVLIGDINKLRVYNDYLVLLDKVFSKKIYVFNKEGKFVRVISSHGGGPGEYSSVSDFTIDETSGEILLLDWNKQKIMRYQIETGKYREGKDILIENKESIISRSIEFFNGKLYADIYCYDEKDDTPLLRELDISTGKQLQTFFNLKEYNKRSHRKFLSGFPFKRLAMNSLLFFHPYMNTVIRIDENGIYPLITIKGKNIFTSDELMQYNLDDIVNDFGMKKLSIDKIPGIRFCCIYQNYIDIAYSQGIKGSTLTYNILKNKAKYTSFLLDDLVYSKEGEKVIFNPEFGDNKGIYNVLPGLALPPFIKAIESGSLNPNIDKKEQLMELTEDSNPVIFYYEYED